MQFDPIAAQYNDFKQISILFIWRLYISMQTLILIVNYPPYFAINGASCFQRDLRAFTAFQCPKESLSVQIDDPKGSGM